MKKLWSFFWLFVAWAVALTLVASWISPYLPVIILIGVGILLLITAYKVIKFIRAGRGNYS